MFLESNNKNECSGCTACMAICPKHAIYMIEDKEGFKYPKIDKQKCVNCRVCYNICPNVKKDTKNKIIEAYGAKHKKQQEQVTSRSGGAFIALSDYILKEDGTIYGAEQRVNDTKNRKENKKIVSVFHSRATTAKERDKFKGSKYVQSDIGTVIKNIKEDLENGKKVLFSGTPCQVAGVKAVISNKYQEQLYTCDLVCHGVPSDKVFQAFLKYIEETSNKKIKNFEFRDKRYGWESHYETIFFEDNTELTTSYFRDLFYGHNILRPSCHICNYANTNRVGDITIADFWGVDKIAPSFLDERGVSLIIVNSLKGKKWFESIKSEMNLVLCNIDDCIKNTDTLRRPMPKGNDREKFWIDFNKENFEDIIKNYTKGLSEVPQKMIFI